MTNPVVSVIVVCYNEQTRIGACLDSILAQDFAEPWEAIIVDNQSTDRTAELVAAKAETNPAVVLVRNDTRTLSVGRNVGWRRAASPLVVYTDADCIVPSHWLRTLVHAYRAQKAVDASLAGVGGGNYQPNDTQFYRALNIFLKSPFGNRGSTQTESFDQGRYVDSLAALNVLYERDALESIDGYDSVHFPRVGEDEDLNSRLAEKGRRIFYVPGCEVLHFWRDTFAGWRRNMYLYGFGRVKLRRRHPSRAKVTDLLCLAVPGALVLTLFSWLWLPLAAPLSAYVLIMVLASLTGSFRFGQPLLAPRVFALLVGTHLWYGMGFIRGIVANKI